MIDYLKNNTDGKPFFGYLAFQVTHSPFQAPEGTISKYDKLYSAGWDEMRKHILRIKRNLDFGLPT